MSDHAYLSGADSDKLAALVMELASQLHVERQRRMALEAALAASGTLDCAALERLAGDDAVLAEARAALDRSIRKLLRIVSESGDPQAPLRGEAPR